MMAIKTFQLKRAGTEIIDPMKGIREDVVKASETPAAKMLDKDYIV